VNGRLDVTAQPVPTLEAEREAWSAGARFVAGLDEVGRGAIAGPVVAAAVVLPCGGPGDPLAGVRDSKSLDAAARCRLAGVVGEAAVGVAVGRVEPALVDALGIARATELAMMRALAGLAVPVDFLLLDAFPLRLSPLSQRAIVRGDRHVLSIAAASVVAKVHRDAEMVGLGARLPDYGFDRHKGYGTAEHHAAIRRHGVTTHHRLSWVSACGASACDIARLDLLRGPGSSGP
jgi:ribonuclease HII